MVALELLDGFCGFSAIVAGSYYCSAEAPPGMLASLNGLIVASTFGAGATSVTDLYWHEIISYVLQEEESGPALGAY